MTYISILLGVKVTYIVNYTYKYTVSQKKTSPTFSTVTWKTIIRLW